MRTQALLLACYLLATAPLCHSIATSPASVAGAADELVVGGMELRRPMIASELAGNKSAAQQLPTEASDGIGYRLHMSWFSLLSEETSPLARDHPFVEQGVVLDQLLVFLVLLVVYIVR